MTRHLAGGVTIAWLASGVAAMTITPTPTIAAAPAKCGQLTTLRLPDTTIESATEVAGPAFTPPGNAAITNLPAFCRVVAVTKPAVRFEVWLPLANWNGNFQGVGNGGTAGVISYGALATGVRRGYAVTSTDTGHVSADSADSSWALNRPDLVTDFGSRGLHVATDNGKQIARAFYDKAPARSIYVGCSKGGQQGLMEAQRFPDDYDGIIAGDPANYSTRSYLAGHLWAALATEKDPDSYIPAAKIPVLADAVTAACDALDGIKDGVIDDPRVCRFDPAVLTCTAGADQSRCFTPKQVKAVKDIWAGARDSAGHQLYPGLLPGAETGAGAWSRYVTGTGPGTGRHLQLAQGFLRYVVFSDPQYDFRRFNYDTDFPRAVATLGPALDAVDPNLQPFERRGGKLIVYHGWNDPSIPPLNSVDYYENVIAALGGRANHDAALARTQKFFRLFMVPGMQHCSGGPGTSSFDMLPAMETWVEKGTAPDRIVASRMTNGRTDRTRPLCPYPQSAAYNGNGSTDEADNFSCRVRTAK